MVLFDFCASSPCFCSVTGTRGLRPAPVAFLAAILFPRNQRATGVQCADKAAMYSMGGNSWSGFWFICSLLARSVAHVEVAKPDVASGARREAIAETPREIYVYETNQIFVSISSHLKHGFTTGNPEFFYARSKQPSCCRLAYSALQLLQPQR